jgi:hypothetical protein
LLTVASGACVSSEEADDTRSGFHNVTVNWTLKNNDGTTMAACPPGFTTMYATFYRNPDGLVTPQDAAFSLPCTPTGTTTQKVATAGELKELDGLGRYDYTPEHDFQLTITEETLSANAGQTPYYHVDPLTSDVTIDFEMFPAGGFGVAAWELQSTFTMAPIPSCATAGVDQVEMVIRPFADDTAPLVVVGTWGCTDVDPFNFYDPNATGRLIDTQYELGSGKTKGIAPGEYYAELHAKRAGVVVGTEPGQLILNDKNHVRGFEPSTNNGSDLFSTAIPINDR